MASSPALPPAHNASPPPATIFLYSFKRRYNCVCARVYLYLYDDDIHVCIVYIQVYTTPSCWYIPRRVITYNIIYGLMRKPCFIACLREYHNKIIVYTLLLCYIPTIKNKRKNIIMIIVCSLYLPQHAPCIIPPSRL